MFRTIRSLSPDKTRVIIVDDHPLVCASLKGLINAEPDLEVCATVSDADEALAQIIALEPALALIDISLKGANGLDLIKKLREHFAAQPTQGTRILVISAREELLFAPRALNAGARGYIKKDAELTQILQAVRAVLNGEIYLSAAMTERLLLDSRQRANDTQFPKVASLTDRELEVFELIGNGLSTAAIAERLRLSIKTIETHQANIKRKLRLENHIELTREAMQWMMDK
ncbi:MAG: response regulator [Thiotrichales bacterium]